MTDSNVDRAPPGASVIVPVLNDGEPLRRLIADLRHDPTIDIVVVDGGSEDDSLAVAEDTADAALPAPRGRALQMRAGTARPGHEWLWLLHADSRVGSEVLDAFADLRAGEPAWGWFDVRLDDERWPFRIIEAGINLRSRASGIATGDQGIFVHRRLLDAVGGVPAQPLVEDVELCKRLRRLAKPRLGSVTGQRQTALTASARRWQQHGIARTVLLMWWLRLRYFLGADPAALARIYYPSDAPGGR